MPVDRKHGRRRIFDLEVGVLLAVLLIQWIKPITDLSEMTDPRFAVPLFVAVAWFVLLDALRVHPAWNILLKGLAAVGVVGWMFAGGDGPGWPGTDWLNSYVGIWRDDWKAAASGAWEDFSQENRTFFFLAGWAMLASVIQSVLVLLKRGFWLVAATFIYLGGLQLWPGLDTTRGLIVSGGAGLVLLAVLQWERLKETCTAGLFREGPDPSAKRTGGSGFTPAELQTGGSPKRPARLWRWQAASAAFATALLIGAYAGAGDRNSRTKPLHPEAFQRLAESWGWEAPSRTKAVSGYGEDDSLLGGALEQDDETVFTARTGQAVYWRGESKSYYDGKGWSQPVGITEAAVPGGEVAALHRESGESIEAMEPMERMQQTVRTEQTKQTEQTMPQTITQEILYSGTGNADQLFSAGRIVSIEALFSKDGNVLPKSALIGQPETGKYKLSSAWGTIGYAKFQAVLPMKDPGKLRLADGADYPAEIRAAYLQIPDSLPQRVKELASAITSQASSPYDKAALVEAYLKNHYTYSLKEAVVPRPGQDFTDAFLFDGKSGYCDYFSTAMTVLLRSAGIPARWVKGFAPGDVQPEASSATGAQPVLAVTVKNKHAHSWVEVYFPHAGWIPFDPTPGFAGFAEVPSAPPAQTAVTAQTGQPSSTAQPPQPSLPGSVPGAFGPALSSGDSPTSGIGAAKQEMSTRINALWNKLSEAIRHAPDHIRRAWSGIGWLASAVILTILPVLLYLRRRWNSIVFVLLLRYHCRGRRQPAVLLSLTNRLWREVFARYGHKLPHQTLREYVSEAGARHPYAIGALTELVSLYEAVRYGGVLPPWVPKRRLMELRGRIMDRPKGGSGMSM